MIVDKQIELEVKLIKDYPLKCTVEYNINMEAIHNIKSPLVELNSMIGMRKLKQNVVDQILYFIQDLHKISNSTTNSIKMKFQNKPIHPD